MRHHPLVLLGALAFAGAAVASGAQAQSIPGEESEPTTTTRQPTTTTPPMTTSTTDASSPPSSPGPSPSTTAARGAGTTTTAAAGRAPIPPPPSGASQPLDSSLLGGLPMIDLNPTTTTALFSTERDLPTTTVFADDNAITVSRSSDGPSGATLALASLAWLASLGGLLVFAEDQRSKQWRHLAR